jgi:hypothetical protein
VGLVPLDSAGCGGAGGGFLKGWGWLLSGCGPFLCACVHVREMALGGCRRDVQGDCDGDGGRGSWSEVVGLVPLDSAGCGGVGGGFLVGWGWLLCGCGPFLCACAHVREMALGAVVGMCREIATATAGGVRGLGSWDWYRWIALVVAVLRVVF